MYITYNSVMSASSSLAEPQCIRMILIVTCRVTSERAKKTIVWSLSCGELVIFSALYRSLPPLTAAAWTRSATGTCRLVTTTLTEIVITLIRKSIVFVCLCYSHCVMHSINISIGRYGYVHITGSRWMPGDLLISVRYLFMFHSTTNCWKISCEVCSTDAIRACVSYLMLVNICIDEEGGHVLRVVRNNWVPSWV